MIQANDCFKKLKIQSIIISKNYRKLIDEAIWSFDLGWTNFTIPEHIWKLEPLLNTINREFPIERCVVLQIDPNHFYNWHTDFFRGASINMKLIDNKQSHTLFGYPIDDFTDKFIELEYEPNTFYLFNTQQRHCVLNFDNLRYMFSVEFKQNKDELTYQNILQWCTNKGLCNE